ncbi:hypothetical protein [Saccharibacillus sacchari]|uniref:hypothetical protein n=1 Tax=Saccharibacillus sacchari TaxID=456493 RepID=UPI0004AC8D58|nr:hypothetical protein [Saccharibacillus sacchari]
MLEYNRISFPNRAEDMRYNEKYQHSYRIYLDHWDSFLAFLSDSLQKVVSRDSSHALAIYGPQGAGKTLFSDKLENDFLKVRKAIQRNELEYRNDNIWQKIVMRNPKDLGILERITRTCEFINITDKQNWLEELNSYSSDAVKIVIADNAERAYFGAALAGVSQTDFLANRAGMGEHVAQQFVRLARTDLRKTLFIILGNVPEYLKSFYDECERQHSKMASYYELDLPTPSEKESIIRRNINRLNSSSYWKYIDSIDASKKTSLYTELQEEETTIPKVFDAIDEAFSTSTRRGGRPANKCTLSFVLVTEELNQANEIASSLAGRYIDHADYEYSNLVRTYNIPENYAINIMDKDIDKYKMLESEFNFQFIIFSNEWIKRLLSIDVLVQQLAVKCLKQMLEEPKIGIPIKAKQKRKLERDISCDTLIEKGGVQQSFLSSFWNLGARRGSQYEDILRGHFEGYNTTNSTGSTSKKRPDIVLKSYNPCSILEAEDETSKQIVQAIVREYHAVEITTIKNATTKKVMDYLDDKIPNYVELLQNH